MCLKGVRAEWTDRSESTTRRGWFELGPIRPPSEGRDQSLLIRATRNCPWNRCRFCTVYKGQRFQYRTVAEVKRDIDAARAMKDELKTASWRLGLGGKMDGAVLEAVMDARCQAGALASLSEISEPELRRNCLVNVANWLASGGQTVFLQDADTTIMRTPELLQVLSHVKDSFPSVTRVTSYARAKTLSRKPSSELSELRQAGLSRLHVGLESGADEVLAYMEKGATATEQTEAGRAVVAAGISLSEYVMPGLGGRRWSERHAMESARVLSEIDPSFIRLRSLAVRKGSPLYEQASSGDFQIMTEDEVVAEIGLFIQNLDCHSYLASDQMANLLWEIEGQLPQDKQSMLATVSRYLALRPMERLKFCLERRRRSFFSIYGGLPAGIQEAVRRAAAAIDSESSDAGQLVSEALMAMKQGFM
jgi:radical SAM superfamily enzyme YgiQ (UPF0313 family)